LGGLNDKDREDLSLLLSEHFKEEIDIVKK
jgi:hypothetical protein